MSEPSKAELITHLKTARTAVIESQQHWAAVVHLTGDRRFQRQHRETLALLDAMLRRVGSMPERGQRTSNCPLASPQSSSPFTPGPPRLDPPEPTC